MPKPASKLPSAPAGPTKGFTTARAQKWVLTCALLTAVMYAFRLIIEPTTGTGKGAKNAAARLAGHGTPPNPEHWAVGYTAAFLILAVVAMGAPELAASLALLATLGNLLANGQSIAADLSQLENGSGTPTAAPAGPPNSVGPAVTTGLVNKAGATNPSFKALGL